MMVRFCHACCRCWTVTIRACPSCGEDRPTYDAFELVERLAGYGLDHDAEKEEAT